MGTELQSENRIVSPYLTASEAAAYLRTTIAGIYSLVKRGRLTPLPGSPGRLLFTRTILDRFLNTNPRRGRQRRRRQSPESDAATETQPTEPTNGRGPT